MYTYNWVVNYREIIVMIMVIQTNILKYKLQRNNVERLVMISNIDKCTEIHKYVNVYITI